MDKRGIASDSVATAGSVFRRMSTTDRQHHRDSRVIQIMLGLLAVVWVVGFSLFFWGSATNGLMVVAIAAAVASAMVFIYLMRGSAAVTIAAISGAAIAVGLGLASGLNWGLLLGASVLTLLLVFGAVTGRTRRLPRLLAGVIAAAITPTVFLLSKVVGGWALLIAALIGAGFVAWQVNLSRRSAAREASRRSSIPMLSTGLFSTSMLGVDPPTGVDQQTLVDRVTANQATARALEELPDDWFVFHSRIAGTGDIVDHVVVGPPGVIAVRSERYPGHLQRFDAGVTGDGVPVTLDGAETGIVVSQVLCETAAAIDLHLMTPNQRRVTRAVLVAHDGTLDGSTMTQDVVANGAADQVTWVTPASIVDYLMSLPAVQLGDQFVADLATVVDFQLSPAD